MLLKLVGGKFRQVVLNQFFLINLVLLSEPFFGIKLSHVAVHQLIGRPFQCHEVCGLMQREVAWNGLHIISLHAQRRRRLFLKEITTNISHCGAFAHYRYSWNHLLAAPARCSFQTEVWLWSFGEVTQHIPSPTWEGDHPCYHWTVSSGSEMRNYMCDITCRGL